MKETSSSLANLNKFKGSNQKNSTKEFLNKKKFEENKTESVYGVEKQSSLLKNKIESNKEQNLEPIEVKIINDLNERNSFLNSIIHIIYSIRDLRDNFLKTNYPCNSFSSILFEMKVIVEKYYEIINTKDVSTEKLQILDPRDLRREIAKFFESEKKFKIRSNDDPIELLFFYINAIHSFNTKAYSVRNICPKKCDPICISHSSIWQELIEEIECECGAKSKPMRLDYHYFIPEIHMKDIFATVQLNEKFDYVNKLIFYFRSLNTFSNSYLTPCPAKSEKCKKNKAKTNRNLYLLNNPNYFIFSLSWKEINPKLTQICYMYIMITHFFNNKDVYDVLDSEHHGNFELSGLICYWAAKYFTILKKYDGASSYWIIYRDMEIIKASHWKDLIEKCLGLHLHPVFLLYRKLSEVEKAHDAKTSLNNEEIIELLKYSKCYDQENELIYKSEIRDLNKMRPTNLVKTYDPKIETSIQKLKDKFEMQKSRIKIKTDEDYQKEFEEEMRKLDGENKINLNKTPLPIKKEKKRDTSKNYIPDLAQQEWECENDFCKNVNSCITHYCLKCRKINYKIKDLVINRTSINIQNIDNNNPNINKINDNNKKHHKKFSEYADNNIKNELNPMNYYSITESSLKNYSDKESYLNSYNQSFTSENNNYLANYEEYSESKERSRSPFRRQNAIKSINSPYKEHYEINKSKSPFKNKNDFNKSKSSIRKQNAINRSNSNFNKKYEGFNRNSAFKKPHDINNKNSPFRDHYEINYTNPQYDRIYANHNTNSPFKKHALNILNSSSRNQIEDNKRYSPLRDQYEINHTNPHFDRINAHYNSNPLFRKHELNISNSSFRNQNEINNRNSPFRKHDPNYITNSPFKDHNLYNSRNSPFREQNAINHKYSQFIEHHAYNHPNSPMRNHITINGKNSPFRKHDRYYNNGSPFREPNLYNNRISPLREQNAIDKKNSPFREQIVVDNKNSSFINKSEIKNKSSNEFQKFSKNSFRKSNKYNENNIYHTTYTQSNNNFSNNNNYGFDLKNSNSNNNNVNSIINNFHNNSNSNHNFETLKKNNSYNYNLNINHNIDKSKKLLNMRKIDYQNKYNSDRDNLIYSKLSPNNNKHKNGNHQMHNKQNPKYDSRKHEEYLNGKSIPKYGHIGSYEDYINAKLNPKRDLEEDEQETEESIEYYELSQINPNLIDHNRIKKLRTSNNFYSNINNHEKEIHGILIKSTENETFRSRYSLSNGFKDKKVTFQENIIPNQRIINKNNKQNHLISSECNNYNDINKNNNQNSFKSSEFNKKNARNKNDLFKNPEFYNKNILSNSFKNKQNISVKSGFNNNSKTKNRKNINKLYNSTDKDDLEENDYNKHSMNNLYGDKNKLNVSVKSGLKNVSKTKNRKHNNQLYSSIEKDDLDENNYNKHSMKSLYGDKNIFNKNINLNNDLNISKDSGKNMSFESNKIKNENIYNNSLNNKAFKINENKYINLI